MCYVSNSAFVFVSAISDANDDWAAKVDVSGEYGDKYNSECAKCYITMINEDGKAIIAHAKDESVSAVTTSTN